MAPKKHPATNQPPSRQPKAKPHDETCPNPNSQSDTQPPSGSNSAGSFPPPSSRWSRPIRRPPENRQRHLGLGNTPAIAGSRQQLRTLKQGRSQRCRMEGPVCVYAPSLRSCSRPKRGVVRRMAELTAVTLFEVLGGCFAVRSTANRPPLHFISDSCF